MPKFDFNSSRYAKFFADKSNQRFLQSFLNTEGLLYTNYGWYKTQGIKASTPTPNAPNGLASFSVKGRELKAAPLMDMRAPLADSNQMDNEGISWYTASIPDFIAPGFVETAMEREAKEKQFELFGNDADIVAAWVQTVQEKIDSADATMNYMTAQLISTGKIYYTGIARGIQVPLHKADIPKDNFVKAGDVVWTDKSCRILSQMAKIEKKFREKWGYQGAMVWQMTRKMFYETFLQNVEVKDLVESYKKNPLAWVATTDTAPTTADLFLRAFKDYPGVSPIEVVEERERNLTNTGDTFVQGWDDKIAVLRPSGYACEFEYTNNLDKLMFDKYGSSVITKVWAQVNDGLCTLVNTTTNNGQYKEWHTDVMMSACPALTVFLNNVIVDTSTAGN